MHLALAASVLFCRCIRSASTNMRLLVWICGSYLWPASLPNEPAVRGRLEGFTQVGSGVFCTSVLTSGSISEGEGVSLAPAMAVCLARALPPEDGGNLCPPPAVRTRRLTQRPTPPSQCRCAGPEGERLLPCRITGSSDALRPTSTRLLHTTGSSIPDGDVWFSHTHASSPCNVNSSANPKVLHNRGRSNVITGEPDRSMIDRSIGGATRPRLFHD